MKPLVHARLSAKKYGGKPEDYLSIHDFMDSSKSTLGDVRHRAIFHNTLGPFVVEKVFGHTLTNADGRVVHTRDVAEDHIMEDLGRIPTVEQWLSGLPIQKWMAGGVARHREDSKPQVAARID